MAEARLRVKVGSLASDPSTREELTTALESFAARCRSRAYPEEGIPAILVVEDLRQDPDRPSPPGAGTEPGLLLAAALELYGGLIREREDALGATDLATALEVLAARYFFATPVPDLPPTPSSDAR